MSEKVIKKCNFCKDAGHLNTEEIPFWSKKNENYSPYPKMVSCEEKYSLKNEDLKPVNTELGDNPLVIDLSFGKDNKNKFIFYWAPKTQDDILTINPPETAYDKYQNHK